jgi:hypothetical protein
MPPPCDAVAVLTAASVSPLAVALCDQDALLTPYLDDTLVQELFSRARADTPLLTTSGSTDVLSVEDFVFVNDALAGALVKQAARIAHRSLLGRLINQGVLLPDALMLCTAIAL